MEVLSRNYDPATGRKFRHLRKQPVFDRMFRTCVFLQRTLLLRMLDLLRFTEQRKTPAFMFVVRNSMMVFGFYKYYEYLFILNKVSNGSNYKVSGEQITGESWNDERTWKEPNLRYKKRFFLVRLRKFTRISFRITNFLDEIWTHDTRITKPWQPLTRDF